MILVCGEALIDLFVDATGTGGSLPASAVAGGSPSTWRWGWRGWGRRRAIWAACPPTASAASWKRGCGPMGWIPPW
ncbi:hypothetical protein ACFQU7_32130 [Pseudoroseomonas wenyumeiae]